METPDNKITSRNLRILVLLDIQNNYVFKDLKEKLKNMSKE